MLYVQIRALANKAAEKALKKAIPFLGAIIGGFSDTYYMNIILTGSNLIYHKRFLFEKEHRVKILESEVNNIKAIESKSTVV